MRWLGFGLRWSKHLLKRLILGLVLLILLTYGGLSWLSAYPERLGGVLSLGLGQPVGVETAVLSWRYGQPVLAVRQLTLYDPASRRPALLLAQADLALSWRWLLGGTSSPAQLHLIGLNLRLLRSETGRWQVEGLVPAATDWAQLWDAWLGREARIQLTDAQLQLYDASGAYAGPSVVRLDAALTQRSEGGHALDLSLRPGVDGEVKLQARWQGNPFAANPAPIETYLQADLPASQLSPWTQAQLQLSPTAGRIRAQAWLSSIGLHPQALQVELHAEAVRWHDTPAAVWQMHLPSLHWQGGAAGQPWQLTLRDLSLTQGEQSVAVLSQVRLTGTEALIDRVRGELTGLRIGAVTSLLRQAPALGDALRAYLGAAAPDGYLREATWAYDRADPPRWRLRGWGEGITAAAWQELPGLAGLRGAFWVHEQGGQAHLDSPALSMDLPKLFRAPLLGAVQGSLAWWPDAGDWHVSSQNIQVQNADLSARSRFDLTLPQDASSPHLDLSVTLAHGRAAAVPRYVPAHITNPKLVAWLDHAALAGDIVAGTVVLQGPLEDFPFDVRPTGRFQARLQVRDVALTYQPRYPPLRQVNAVLEFDARSLAIQIERGKTLDADLHAVHIRVAQLRKEGVLEVQGQVKGKLTSGLEFLRTTPLQATLGRYIEDLNVTGPMALQLGLQMPFLDVDAISVLGQLQLRDASLTWEAQPLDHIRGEMRFTTHGLEAQGVAAQFHGWPVELALVAAKGQTRLTAKGQLTPSRLRTLAGLPPDWPGISGAADWQALLTLSDRPGQPSRLEASSTLQGLALDLPAPFGKRADTGRELRLTTELRADAEWNLRYSDMLWARFRLASESQAAQVALQLGVAPTLLRLPEQGVRLRGQLAQVELDAWRKLIPPVESGELLLPTLDAQLRIAELTVNEQIFETVNLTAQGDPGALQVKLSSPGLSLDVQQPTLAGAPWQVQMQRLHLRPTVETQPPTLPTPLSAEGWPALVVECAELRYGGKLLGRLRLAGQPTVAGWELTQLQLEQPRLVVRGEGYWRKVGWDVSLSLETENLGVVLQELLDIYLLDAASGTAQVRLVEVPAPLDWRYWRGDARLTLREGGLAEVEPGVGGRLLGLAGWQGMLRRLQLDFKDLFGKGLQFETLEAQTTLTDGVMQVAALRISGPAAQIKTSGTVGLVARDYDLQVAVTPKATATLPLTGALTAGPAVGAALLVAQQLLGSELDKLARRHYAVTGNWDNPQINSVAVAEPQER